MADCVCDMSYTISCGATSPPSKWSLLPTTCAALSTHTCTTLYPRPSLIQATSCYFLTILLYSLQMNYMFDDFSEVKSKFLIV